MLSNTFTTILLVLLLTSCRSSGGYIVKDFNREGQDLTVNVELLNPKSFESRAEDGRNGLKGEVIYYKSGNECNILIKKTSALRVDDSHALTLGHELMHCLYGDYHK